MTAEAKPSMNRIIPSINIPYLDREVICFSYPFEGPFNYRDLGKRILDNQTLKLSLPDGEKTSFLLRAAYCGHKEFQKHQRAVELRDGIMEPSYFYLFQINTWTNKGLYVEYDPEAIGISGKIDIDRFERQLERGVTLKNKIRFSKDGGTGFAPRETYRGGEFTPDEFAKDGVIIARNKVQGAKNLAEISQSKYFRIKKPRSWIIEPENEPIQTVSALGSYDGVRLGFYGVCHGVGLGGCASGVFS
ncbi:hypothetical protein J4466_03510 [Candidatus Pacearchaeota archaeon]|nr:hypothetical protein [Candidatus Pacearchaeota archaeon]